MTALVPIPSKGVAVLQSVSSVYVAMDALNSVEVTGRKSTTYPFVALNGSVTRKNLPDGYADPAVLKLGGFYHPTHATYTAFEGLIAAPVATNFKVTWSDAGPTSVIYNGTGFGIDIKAEPGKGVMATMEITTSGDPT